MKIVTQEEIENRISKKYNNQPFKIIEYTKVSKPFTIQCLTCGQTIKYSSLNNFMNSKRKNLCQCLNENSNYATHKKTIEKTELILKNNLNIKFISYWYKKDTKKNMVEVECNKCKQHYSKPLIEFNKNCSCPYCIGRELLNTEAIKSLVSEEYEIIGEYNRDTKKIKVRHKECGFIWETKACKLYNYIGCPHCNKKQSKGEKIITNYLIKNGYEFEAEKSFKWQSNLLRRYDFYIPEYKLICEYNGEQHYKENKYFKTPLLEQQIIDEEKKKEAIDNGYNYLVIAYYDFNSIESILNNWFNDYPNMEQT